MSELFSAFFVWFVSIVVSIVSIIQTKGKDWYQPITNKQKMIMTIINIFILFLVMVFMQDAILFDLKKTLIVSLIIILIVVFFANSYIYDRIKSIFKGIRRLKSPNKEKTPCEADGKGKPNSFKIKEHIQKLLTIFNCTFFLLNVIRVFIIIEIKGLSSYRMVITEHSQIVAFVTVFWLTLVGAIITSMEWTYSEVVYFVEKKKVKKDANYYTKKIGSRNR